MAVTFGYENSVPCMYFDGSGVYYPPDTTGIVTGTESWIMPTQQGLTLGCWVKPDFLPTQISENGTFIGKIDEPASSASGSYGYVLDFFYPGNVRFWISSTGGYSETYADSLMSNGGITANDWQFVAGRWNTTDTSVFINTTKLSVISTQSSIVNTPATLTFGGWANGYYKYQGYMAYPFISAASLSDEQITNIYNRTRTLFGV